MNFRLAAIATPLTCLLLLGACAYTPDGQALGTGGAITGAVIGGARGGVPGAIIGGIVGGAVGSATGDAIDHANGYPYPEPYYAPVPRPVFVCHNEYRRFAYQDGYGYWHPGWVRSCP
jgi:hypothetical protein